MPKKQWTDEERKAFAERMKKARETKTSQTKSQEPSPSAPDTADRDDSIEKLLKRIEELEQRQFIPNLQAQVTNTGVKGTTEKFSVNPKDYPDPRERLADEPRLKRFAFRENYELEWDISRVRYDTKDGLSFAEPKFVIKLNRRIFDDDGEPTKKWFTVLKGTFFEDPDTALTIAQQRGLDIPDFAEKPFLDEMRYLRLRDWLMEVFFPPKPDKKAEITETVIGNRLVNVFEKSSEDSSSVPFDKL